MTNIVARSFTNRYSILDKRKETLLLPLKGDPPL